MRRILLAFYSLIFTGAAMAQTNGSAFNLPTVIPNAPQAASLGRYGDIPVSINTGVPSISVPLYTIQSGKISVPVSFNYHGSGIRVMDRASSVGLGWALNAGGDISRVVQGVEDEDSYGGFNHMLFPDANDPALEAKEKCLASNICNTYDGQEPWDGQPDLYFYTLGNKSGQFIPKNWRSANLQPGFMTMPFSPIKIDYGPSNVPRAMPTIVITDVDGTQYTFGPYDSTLTTNNTSSRVHNAATAWHLQKILSADKMDSVVFKYAYVSFSWYVTNNPRVLNRLYDAFGVAAGYSYTTPTANTNNVTEYLLSEIDFNNGKMSFDYSQGGDASNSTHMDAVHLYNGDPGAYSEIRRWTLYHSDFQSPAVTSGYTYALRLDSVQETGYYGNNTVSQPPYAFSYYTYTNNDGYQYQCPIFNSYAQDFWGYFNGQTANQDLTFVAISSLASNDPPSSAAYKRKPDSNYLKVGTLHTMRYPTGGNSVFDFEPNQTTRTYMKSDTTFSFLSGGYVTTFNETATDKSMTTVTFTLNQSLLTQAAYNGNNVKLDFTGSPVCTSGCVSDDPIVKLDDVTAGTTIATIELSQLNNSNPPSLVEQVTYLTLITGHTYKLYLPNPGTLTGTQGWTNLTNRLDATLSGQAVANINTYPVTETVLTGGLRIRQVTSSDGAGRTLVKEYRYPGVYYNSSLFHGDFDDVALNNYSFDGYNLMAVKNGQGCGLFGRAMTHYASNLVLPLGASSNNSISYNEVEEYESDGRGNYNGKTVFDYNKVLDIVNNGMPFYKVSKEFDRGLMLEKRTYKYVNGGYALLQDMVNNYTDLDSTYANTDTVVFYTAHALVDNAVTKGGNPATTVIGGPTFGCLGCTNFDMQTKYLVNRFYYTSSRSVAKSATITEYDDNGHSIVTQTSYDYQNPLHAWPTHEQKMASDGKTIDQYSKYVLDYLAAPSCTNSCMTGLTAQLNALKATYFPLFGQEDVQFHINQTLSGGSATPLCSPINPDSVTWYENVYQQNLANYQQAVDSLCTIYNSCITGYNTCVANYYSTATDDAKGLIDLQGQHNILPELEQTVYRNSNLISTTQTYYKTFSPGNTQESHQMASTGNNALENRMEFLGYDNFGKIKMARKSSDLSLSYVWDYHDEFPIAEVRNADTASIAYTSFEADGMGGWNYTASTRTPVPGITGSKSYNLQDGSISRQGLTSGKSYIISYWSQNGSYSISGGTATTRTGKTVNGWTYYEHAVTTASSTLTVSGGGWIDELRCYPSQAQMTTYTYDPLIGMTSQSDADGRITYYFYDGLGRLVTVKDQDGNIIKTLEYHYQNQ